MQINHILWDKVTINYDEPVRKIKTESFVKASVRFNDGALTIADGTYNSNKSILLTKAKLIALSPWDMTWEAYWWEGEIGVEGFTNLVRADVVCTF